VPPGLALGVAVDVEPPCQREHPAEDRLADRGAVDAGRVRQRGARRLVLGDGELVVTRSDAVDPAGVPEARLRAERGDGVAGTEVRVAGGGLDRNREIGERLDETPDRHGLPDRLVDDEACEMHVRPVRGCVISVLLSRRAVRVNVVGVAVCDVDGAGRFLMGTRPTRSRDASGGVAAGQPDRLCEGSCCGPTSPCLPMSDTKTGRERKGRNKREQLEAHLIRREVGTLHTEMEPPAYGEEPDEA
jgi:hypothetical protein